jgi:hypothetical protein
MSKNKLQNIKALQQMLEGNHKFQTKKTVGFSDAKETSKRNERHDVGDVWEETDAHGNVYVLEQKDGFRVRKTKNSDVFQEIRDGLKSFPKCRKETCTCLTPNHLDEKMRKFNGMCYDCTIEFEHEMRKAGTYDEYERERIKNNALAWLRTAEQDLTVLKQTYTEASKFVTNAEGEIETYAARMTPEEFNEKVEEQFNKFKTRFLSRLEGENNEND